MIAASSGVLVEVGTGGRRIPRRLMPIVLYFGSNEDHPKQQWLLLAHDLDTGADCTLAMREIRRWGPLP